jgi:hypothetical protein
MFQRVLPYRLITRRPAFGQVARFATQKTGGGYSGQTYKAVESGRGIPYRPDADPFSKLVAERPQKHRSRAGKNSPIYDLLFRRNAVYVGVFLAGAVVLDKMYDQFMDEVWDSKNKGKKFEQVIPVQFPNLPPGTEKEVEAPAEEAATTEEPAAAEDGADKAAESSEEAPAAEASEEKHAEEPAATEDVVAPAEKKKKKSKKGKKKSKKGKKSKKAAAAAVEEPSHDETPASAHEEPAEQTSEVAHTEDSEHSEAPASTEAATEDVPVPAAEKKKKKKKGSKKGKKKSKKGKKAKKQEESHEEAAPAEEAHH